MRRLWFLAAFIPGLALGQPAAACIIYVRPKLEDVRYADLVVVGRVSRYRVIRDEAFRRKMLQNPRLSPEERKLYKGRGSLMSDYARFEIEVSEVLVGRAPRRLTVTWDNATYGEPATMAPGPYLIALRKPSSPAPPLRGPSATIFPTPEPALHTLLQAPCSGPILFKATSEDAHAIRKILKQRRR